jgi:hypothetical protein
MGVVSPTKGDPAVGHGDEVGVGDGNTVGIAGEMGQDLGGSGKGTLGIYHPVALGSGAQQRGEHRWGLERSQLTGEVSWCFRKARSRAARNSPRNTRLKT